MLIFRESDIPSDLLDFFEPVEIPDNIPISATWDISTKPFAEAHFATFPEDLIVPMIKSSVSEDGVVYDPFMGAGTTGVVAKKLGRHYVGSEMNPKYIEMAERRIGNTVYQPDLFNI